MALPSPLRSPVVGNEAQDEAIKFADGVLVDDVPTEGAPDAAPAEVRERRRGRVRGPAQSCRSIFLRVLRPAHAPTRPLRAVRGAAEAPLFFSNAAAHARLLCQLPAPPAPPHMG